jgi:hypothetical protein
VFDPGKNSVPTDVRVSLRESIGVVTDNLTKRMEPEPGHVRSMRNGATSARLFKGR